MLLLNEKDIKPEIIKVFDEIKNQLISAQSILNNLNYKIEPTCYYRNLESSTNNLKKLVNKVLTESNFNIFFETYLTNDKNYSLTNELSLLMSVLNLDTKSIKEIETEYNIKLPKEYQTKNDHEIIKEFKQLIVNLNKKNLLDNDQKLFYDVIQKDSKDILTNFIIKNVVIDNYSYKNIISFLKTQVHSKNSNVNIKYFNKLFNTTEIESHCYDKKELENIIQNQNNIVIGARNNSNKLELININNLEQIDGMTAIELGFITNSFTIKNNNFYIDHQKNIFKVSKASPILNMELENIDYNNNYSKKITDNGYLSSDGLFDIRKNIFLKKTNWQKGSIIKIDDCLIYLKSNIKIEKSDTISIQGIILKAESEFNYYEKDDIIFTKKAVLNTKQADDFEKLFFLEMINASYNLEQTYKINNRTERKLGW